MLSDVTISVGTQSITLPGLYLLIGVLIALGLAGFVVAMASSRRIERKTSEAADVLVVQLDRIGDALDRLVTQSAQGAANETTVATVTAAAPRQRDRFLQDWPIPGKGTPPQPRVIPENSALERAARKPAPESVSSVAPVPQAQVVELAQANPPEKQSEDQPL